MEYMVEILTLCGIFLAIVIYGKWEADRYQKYLISKIRKEKGNPSDKEYKVERYERIPGYFEKHKEDEQIDSITWQDLDMDSLFQKMDYTKSSTGEEYLYYLLHSPKKEEELSHFEEMVSFYQKEDECRVIHESVFMNLGGTGKYSLYDYIDFVGNLGEKTILPEVFKNLLYLPAVGILILNAPLGVVAIVAVMLYQLLNYVNEKKRIEPYIISLAYISRLYGAAKNLEKEKNAVFHKEIESIRNLRSSLSISQFGKSVVFSKRVVAGSNPLELLWDYVNACFHLDLILFYHMLGQIRSHLKEIDMLISVLGRMEAAISVSLYRSHLEKEGRTYTTPVFLGERLEIEDGVHPLLQHPVANSIITNKGVLLTGSNASGKSTFLKMVAINCILAQTIHTVMAKRYQAPRYLVYSSMSLKDHMERSESYFIVEIKAMKRILDARHNPEGQKVICFVDEVLRGTNTVERIAAATQILKSLQGEGITCFAATHDLELADLLMPQYDNYHFEEEIVEEDVRFSYQLKEGKATTRNAIRLLRVLEYDENIVEEAQRMADHFMENGCWH